MEREDAFVGIGGLADRLGLSRTRIRQLEDAGAIPAGARLTPGRRRVWRADEVEAIWEAVEERRRSARKETQPATA